MNKTANSLGRNGLHIQALDTYFNGLEIRKNIYGNENYNLAPVYLGIGITYRTIGQYDLALKYFNLAEKNYQLNIIKYSNASKARLYSNIGNVYRSKLDFNRALDYFNQTLELYQNSKASIPGDIANINYKIADVYYSTNNYDKAFELIQANIKNAYAEDQILFYELLAFIYQLKGNFKESRKSYQNAIKLTITINEENHINIARQYLNYTLLLISINEYEEANSILNKAFNIIKITQPKQGIELAAYYNLKGFYVRNTPIREQDIKSFSNQKKQNLIEAIDWYSEALSALNFPTNYSIETINNSNRWLSVLRCIDILKKIADTNNDIALNIQDKKSKSYIQSLSNAIENYQIAGSLIQKARKEISSDESKIQLTELEQSTFYKLIETAFNAYSVTGDNKFIELAFQSAERTKSSSLFDKLSDELALDNSLIPDSLIQLEKRLNNTISILSEKLFEENSKNESDSNLIKKYNTDIFEANRRREELNQFLEAEYNDYYELKYSQSLLSISEIQQELSGDEIILEYVLNETDSISELYTFIISKSDLKFKQQRINPDIIESIESMFHFMSNSEYMLTTNEDSKAFCVSSSQLYNVLVAPHYREIQNKRLVIVPDGKLSYIAFDALLQQLPDTTKPIQFNQLNYLIKDYIINYSNSSNLLYKHKTPSRKLKNKVIAFAPEYSNDSIKIANQNFILAPLPGAQQEVELISKKVNAQILKGDEATESNFRKNIEKYDILHLAMHAFINDSLSSFSRLAFKQDSSTNLASDGWINTTDIYNLKLNAKLAVLSACSTGSGQLRKGEGMMSLARGFFYAGCPSVIMSLWEIEDQSATQIMVSFYKFLKKGKTKDEALRLSKLEYLENSNSRRAHPHYWLGYINLGDNSSLYRSYDFYFFIIVILLIIGITTDQIYRIKKARKKRAF